MATNKFIQSILQIHYAAYLEKHKQSARVIKRIKSQIRCRTKSQGVSHYICPEDGTHKEIAHSCRDKGCTVCGKKRQQNWLNKQSQRLLNTEHYHVVFTLPKEYHRLWLYNRDWFIKAQFEASTETLRDLLEGNKKVEKYKEGKLNAQVGIIATLHTWGRSLNLHPHIHILITAGGLDKKGHWKALEGDYLLPVKQVKALYRGKLQAKIKELLSSNTLVLPSGQSHAELEAIYKQTYQKEWSVRIQEKYSHGKGVLIYLSRYLGSQPVKPEQLQLINHNKEILFTYWSHRDQQKKQQRLSIEEFLRRYLIHQSNSGTHNIRYYGLYASQSKEKHQRCEEQLGKVKLPNNEGLLESLTGATNAVLCECCQGIMQLSYVVYYSWKLKNPLYSRSPRVLVLESNIKQITEPILVQN